MCKILNITQEQKDLTFGTSLGDGFSSTTTGKLWRYEAHHLSKQKDYIFHKYKILKPFCKALIYSYKSKKSVHHYYKFATLKTIFWVFMLTFFIL